MVLLSATGFNVPDRAIIINYKTAGGWDFVSDDSGWDYV